MNSAARPAATTGSFTALPVDEPFQGIGRQAFSSEEATVTRYSFTPGATFPLHHHPQEQITLVEAGAIEMTIADQRIRLRRGDWSIVPAEVEHGIVAGTQGATVIAFVSPARSSSDEYELSQEAGER